MWVVDIRLMCVYTLISFDIIYFDKGDFTLWQIQEHKNHYDAQTVSVT